MSDGPGLVSRALITVTSRRPRSKHPPPQAPPGVSKRRQALQHPCQDSLDPLPNERTIHHRFRRLPRTRIQGSHPAGHPGFASGLRVRHRVGYRSGWLGGRGLGRGLRRSRKGARKAGQLPPMIELEAHALTHRPRTRPHRVLLAKSREWTTPPTEQTITNQRRRRRLRAPIERETARGSPASSSWPTATTRETCPARTPPRSSTRPAP